MTVRTQKTIQMIQSLWNPFRDWNKAWETYRHARYGIQSLWNPFRDWNRQRKDDPVGISTWFKASETLLGIETRTGKF